MELAAVVQSAVYTYEMIFDSDEEESDDEMDKLLNSVVQGYERVTPTRIQLFVEMTVKTSTDEEFQRDFRLTRTTFYRMLELVSSHLSGSTSEMGRPKTDAERQLLAVLWLLATLDSYQ